MLESPKKVAYPKLELIYKAEGDLHYTPYIHQTIQKMRFFKAAALFSLISLTITYSHAYPTHLDRRNPDASSESHLHTRALIARANKNPGLKVAIPAREPPFAEALLLQGRHGYNSFAPPAVQPPERPPPRNAKEYHNGLAAHHDQGKQKLQDAGVKMPNPKDYPHSGPIGHYHGLDNFFDAKLYPPNGETAGNNRKSTSLLSSFDRPRRAFS
jgi:hypothetical protein